MSAYTIRIKKAAYNQLITKRELDTVEDHTFPLVKQG